MKKGKLSVRAVISLVLTAILFCMPAIGYTMNHNNTMSVYAEENAGKGEEEPKSEKTEESGTDTSSEQTSEADTEQETETVSGSDTKAKCTCEDRCTRYEFDDKCEVCGGDYTACEYKKPNVTISIKQPEGWYNDKTVVHFTVMDAAHTGNFEIAKIMAKVGQNGSWTDIIEDKKLEISENCTVYVQVTDQKGNTYERSRSIKCFDTMRPTLNAAISDGLLTVQVHDTDSGAKVVYINGYEFTNLTNGTLNVRLQQFDAGYEYFTISAMDNAGNMSEVYKTKNPYYKDPSDTSDNNPAEQLPKSAEATKPGSATGIVTEHTKTDSNGNTIAETGKTAGTENLSPAEQKKKAMAEADASEQKDDTTDKEQGKEFYTIQTASEKVFYLIVDRDGEDEKVYFLTEVTENDLLNTTSDNSETLPKNSAALESAIPTSETALPNNNAAVKEQEQTEEVESTEESTEESTKSEANPMISYILMGVLGVAVIGGAYYFKVVKKKKEDFVDDDEDEEEDPEEYENEDEDTKDSEDDFFTEQDEEE